MKDFIQEFYEYHIWSYQSLCDHLNNLPIEILNTKFENGFKSIAEVLTHVYNTDDYWQSLIMNKNRPEKKDKLEINEFKDQFIRLHDDLKKRIFEIQDTNENIEFTSRSGNPMINSIGEILLTVVNHGTYHRGNISTMLSQIGYQSVSTDYAFYLRRIRGS